MNELKLLDRLVSSLEKLPGVGKKTATRYAFHIVEKFSDEDVKNLIDALVHTKESVRHCQICHVMTDQNECEICQNPVRDHSQIMVVKDTKDVISIEKSRQYNGLYHVLGGLISPLDGIGPDDINLETLAKRAEDPSVKEIIIATSFTPAGETTALYIDKIVARPGLTVTKIGYGLPAGGDIEYADELTLRRALEARKKI